MGPEQDTKIRRVVAVSTLAVVVLLMLLLITTEYSIVDRNDDEPDDEYPDWLEPPPLIISDDIEWNGRNETLSNPLIIADGTTLKVTRSELRVELIDLVLGNQSWITVEKGGRLELVDTNLSIVYEEWLETAVVAAGYKYRDHPFSVSRAVNLESADRPVLEFDLRWYLGKGHLTVAVQPSPGECMTVLKVFAPDTNWTDEWTHCMVPLSAYSGQVVRVILFTDDRGHRDVILGNLLVSDGGHDLPNDSFPTGKAWEDGWKCDRFGPFFLSMAFELGHWRPLISASGAVVIERSSITAPDALYRHDLGYSSSKYQLERYSDPLTNTGPQWSDTAGGGHIFIDGGRIVASHALFANVPVIVIGGEIDFDDSELEGDCDLLALDRSHGNVVRSRFSAHIFDPRQRSYYSNEPRVVGTAIGISFNTSKGPVSIQDCRINGSYIGLDLNRAWVEVTDCTVEGIKWIGVWDHDSKGLGNWEQLSSSNVIGNAGLYSYFHTHTAIFEMEGPGRPKEGSWFGVFTGIIDWPGRMYDGYTLNNRIIHVDPYRTYILMPSLTVDGEGVENRIEEVTLNGGTSWGGYTHLRLDTDRRSGTIPMDPNLVDNYIYWDDKLRYKFTHSYAGSPGVVSIGMDVDVPQNYSLNYWVIFYLDGEVDAVYSSWEANDSQWGNYDNAFNHTFKVPRGRHALGIELLGQHMNEDTSTQLLNDTRWYYYAAIEEEEFVVRDFMVNGCGTAILSSEIDLTLYRWPTSFALEDEDQLTIFLEEGARLRVSGANIPINESVKLIASGRGSVELYDIEVETLKLTLDGCDLTCDNASANVFEVIQGGENLRLSNITGLNKTGVYLSNRAILHMVDSQLSLTDHRYYSIISVSESSAILSNITIVDEEGYGLSVGVGRNGTFEMTNSTFWGASLGIYTNVHTNRQQAVNASLLIVDNVFYGEGAHLTIHDNSYGWIAGEAFSPDSRIKHNLFTGGGTILTCHRHLVDWLFEDNEFPEGSAFYAMYGLRYSWAEGVDSNDLKAELRLDEELVRVSEEVLGHEWERWDPVYVKGTLDPLILDDPEPIPIIIKGEYYTVGHSRAWWVMGFSHLDPMVYAPVLDVPEWDSVSDLVWAHYGDAWNQGS